jgi:hypothetical protein
MIEICNLRKENPTRPYDVCVDRSSPLGNPYSMANESQRNKVCDEYEKWFHRESFSMAFSNECQHLLSIYERYGKLRLFCWCAPKRCHSETIKRWLESQL